MTLSVLAPPAPLAGIPRAALPEATRPTPESELDSALERLRASAQQFARAPVVDKVRYLREIRKRFHEVSGSLTRLACAAKSIDPHSPLAGEEWLGGPVAILRNLRLLADALDQTRSFGAPLIPESHLEVLPNGRVAVTACPLDAFDAVLLRPYFCQVWLRPEVDAARIPETQAIFYQRSRPEGRVSLVLGAGNVNSIPVMDVLYKMFVEGSVCLLKLSPVNAYLGEILDYAFRPLLDAGFLRIAQGGAETGAYLCQHSQVDEIHITGSNDTHDLIVWGPPGAEREARKLRKEPLLRKRITSELGNISPVMVVPGTYTASELKHVALGIAGMLTQNASFNCNAAKLLVLPAGWSGRQRLLEELELVLSSVAPRVAFYPGAQKRYLRLTQGDWQVRRIGEGPPDTLPWTLVYGLDPRRPEPHFQVEPFCSVLSVVELGGNDPVEFLATATEFVNREVWGTLNAMFFVPGRVDTDPSLQGALEGAIEALRYGTVCVNHWPAAGYLLAAPPWGGYPGAALTDIQSGVGWVHNTLMLESAEKVVVRGPLRFFPRAIYLPGHRTLQRLGAAWADFEASPSWAKAAKMAFYAARG